jgi:hypothetical protein
MVTLADIPLRLIQVRPELKKIKCPAGVWRDLYRIYRGSLKCHTADVFKAAGPKAGGRLLLDAEFFDVASLVKVGFEPIGFWPFC